MLGSYETNGKINIDRLYENLKNVTNLKYNKDILSDSNKIENLPADVEINGEVYEIKEDGSVISVVNTIKPGEKVKSENTAYTNNGTAIIPVGFSIVPGLDDVSQGLVISDVENDINNNGNQFVWIPVTNANSYIRNTNYPKNFKEDIKYDIGYMPNDIEIGKPTAEKTIEELTFEKEKEMVISKKGFYISRYEAGKETVENVDKLVSKKEIAVWNKIPQEEAKETAKTFINNENVKSSLISGIQWDMVMTFVNEKNDGEGNKYYVEKYEAKRHKDSSVEIQQSGQNDSDKVCNIYDLEGNCGEYVAEKNDTSNPCVTRGGINGDEAPASSRRFTYGLANGRYSFRFMLYVM